MSIQLLYSYSRDPSVPIHSYNGKHAKIVFHLRTFNSIFKVLQGVFNIRASIAKIEARAFFSATGAADRALYIIATSSADSA